MAELDDADVVTELVGWDEVELDALVDEDDGSVCEAELTTVVPGTVVTPVLSWATEVETPAVGV